MLPANQARVNSSMRNPFAHVSEFALDQSIEKLKELKQILRNIGSLRNGPGADIFFSSLAKHFSARPVVPVLHESVYKREDSKTGTKSVSTMYRVKTKTVTGVGGGMQTSQFKSPLKKKPHNLFKNIQSKSTLYNQDIY